MSTLCLAIWLWCWGFGLNQGAAGGRFHLTDPWFQSHPAAEAKDEGSDGRTNRQPPAGERLQPFVQAAELGPLEIGEPPAGAIPELVIVLLALLLQRLKAAGAIGAA